MQVIVLKNGIKLLRGTKEGSNLYLRVPPAVAERIGRLLNETPSSSEDKALDLSFSGIEIAEQEEDRDENAGYASTKEVATPSTKPDVPEAGTVTEDPDESDSDDSDVSI